MSNYSFKIASTVLKEKMQFSTPVRELDCGNLEVTSLILPADEVIRHQGRRQALRSHEAGDWCCLCDNLALDERERETVWERQRKTRRLAAGLKWDPFTMAAAAAGWNQFYLYQSSSSVSRNPPHTADQPGGKLMCFPIMKWNTAKNTFKKVSGWSPSAVQHCLYLWADV